MPDKRLDFTEFVIANRPRLFRAARLLTSGDDGHAEDLVQQTLTKLYVRWQKVQRTEEPRHYAYRTLTNTYIDQTRRLWRRRETVALLDSDRPVPPADHATRAVVLSALDGLPPRQRAVVVLRHWLDQDVATTARMLGCSEGTVKSQNAKALAHLRQALGTLAPAGPGSVS